MRRLALIAVPLGLYAAGCGESNAQTPRAAQSARQQTTSASSKAQQGRDTSGRFVSHVEHIQPGGVPIPRGMVLRNPYDGNAAVVATGAKLFVAYNCIDCHGADGSGARLLLPVSAVALLSTSAAKLSFPDDWSDRAGLGSGKP